MIKHKYNATKTKIGGITFDSKLEANCFKFLGDKIVELQPSFELQPKFRDMQGNNIRAIKYIADFMILHNRKIIVIDAKGFPTDVYKMKAKMLAFHHPFLEFYAVKSVKQLKELLETL